MNLKKNNYTFLRIILLINILIFSACKENIHISTKVSPANDTVGIYSTSLGCITHTFFDDTISTSTNIGGIPIYQAIGSITDPFFGNIIGATYFQVIPAASGFTFAVNDTIDSVVMVMPYSGYTWGDTANQTITQSYQVFYLTDSIGYSTNYNSYNTKPIDFTNPLSKPVSVNLYHLKDSLFPVYYQHQSGLRIKLDSAKFLSKLNSALIYTAASGNPLPQTFINYFNGLCVKVADSRQSTTAMPYFELDGSTPYAQAGVLVYYHAYPGDTSYAQFYYNTTYCAHLNNVNNSFSRYPVNNLYQSTQVNDSIIALQNQPGAGIDIKIYGINSLPKGIINKAELVFPLLPAYNNTVFYGPEKIYTIGISSATYPQSYIQGQAYTVADRYPLTSITPLTMLDGYPHGAYYSIDIPRELMQAIAQKSDTIHLHINGTQDFYGAAHLVCGGGNYPVTNLRTKLNVVYSKINY